MTEYTNEKIAEKSLSELEREAGIKSFEPKGPYDPPCAELGIFPGSHYRWLTKKDEKIINKGSSTTKLGVRAEINFFLYKIRKKLGAD